jgi:hypothetical protein
MGQLFENLRHVVEDIRTSWYFRVWAALWFVCALVAFIGMIELAIRSDEAGKEKDWNFWIENSTSIEFPRFRFRFANRSESTESFVGTPNCTHLGQPVTIDTCAGHTSRSKCFVVVGSGIIAQNNIDAPPGEDAITCHFNSTGFNETINQLVGWELDHAHPNLGSRYYNTIWLGPRNSPGVWIFLKKAFLQPQGAMNRELAGPNGIPVWEKSQLYHSTSHTPGYYVVRTLISSFRIDHFEQTDSYDGWMAVGGMGGFAFWMVILHTIAMIVVGFILSNESKFLNHGHGIERAPIL